MASFTSNVPDAALINELEEEAAEHQKALDHAKNLNLAATTIGKKMEEHPESITAKDASTIKSAEAKYTGVAQPPKGTLSAHADQLASNNANAAKAEKSADESSEKKA
ncbi:hypothetical protein KVT40_000077 [Elsinoe batatas]|uniref:SMP domain-containing protein n=1 Tax=Elsinoe batatas TaxID=2601811 RepID=A0A8K0L837_9PEZI|nr:hypothetical protein KVT40_000077 [Elsinoe batatas]